MTESETIEFKKSLAELKTGLVSIAAILNKHGKGELWFGIRNDGNAVGVDASEKSLREISQAIAAHIEPKIFPQVTIETISGVNCVRISFRGKETPYYAFGRAYMRVADEDRQLTAKELENLILSKNRDFLRWDNEVSTVLPSKIDEKKLKYFVEHAGLVWDTKMNVLEKLGLIKDGLLVNAALLFFSKIAPMQLRCAVFASTDSATIIDRHDFDGDILELIEEAQKYILKNIHIGMRLKGLYREDVPEISIDAMREAIINAFCHRDYRDPDYVQIAIFKDRVEIRNPGGLFDGMTIEKMLQGNISKRRNPLIADLLRRIQMVEAWGRGMPLILKNAPDAKFREIAKIFIATFDRPSFAVDEQEALAVNLKKNNKTIQKGSQKGSQKSSQKILDLIRENPLITIERLSVAIGISDRAVKKHLANLKEQGYICRKGADKGGSWELVK
ncbi:MAG: putative DNA binding domain-containing protein [Candidatus Riflebacteria bacterium]|nr:putative DNA binding domain-containing protein [Candidatus Riflebacteria bacterium]